MRLVFAGTPDFAVPSLDALLRHDHKVVAVYTQPDRPAGRGRQAQASPVKRYAIDHGLPVRQPTGLAGEIAALQSLAPDAIVVVAYGLILPADILALPKFGCLNVHASLLPRWRGAAPIQRAIEAGDPRSGVTIMQMDAGLDTGAILLQRETPIKRDDTGGSLHERLAVLGAETLAQALDAIVAGELQPQTQDESEATYARKLSKRDGDIDWSQPADLLARRVRAFNPWPAASCTWHGRRLRVLAAHAEDGDGSLPGTVLATGTDGIRVATGEGALVLTRLQPEGGTAQEVRAFLNGRPMQPGERLQ